MRAFIIVPSPGIDLGAWKANFGELEVSNAK